MNKNYRVDGKGFFFLAVRGDKSGITFARTLTYDTPAEHTERTLKGKSHFISGEAFLDSVCDTPFEIVRDNIVLCNVYVNHYDSNLNLFLEKGRDKWMAFGQPTQKHGFVVNDVEFREICKVHDVVVRYRDLRERI